MRKGLLTLSFHNKGKTISGVVAPPAISSNVSDMGTKMTTVPQVKEFGWEMNLCWSKV